MQPNLSVNIKWGQIFELEWGHMYEYLIFSKYISHKKRDKIQQFDSRLWSELSLPTNSLEI